MSSAEASSAGTFTADHPPRSGGADTWRGTSYWLLLAVLVGAVAYPLLMVLVASFRDAPPGVAGSATLAAWRETLADGRTWSTLVTTARVVLPRVALSMTVASLFAWLVTRTNMPGRRTIEALLSLLFFLPALPMVVAWTLLLAPRTGLVNEWLQGVPGVPTFNVYSYEALVVLGATNSIPVLFLFLVPAFRNMDAALEESSQMSGASRFTTLRRITLPLMLPSLVGTAMLSLIVNLESFEFEQILGVPASIFVFTTEIYARMYGGTDPDFGAGAVLGLLLLTITLVLVTIQRRVLRGRSYTTVMGKGFSARPIDLGWARWPATLGVVVYIAMTGLLPLGVLLVSSFMRVYGFFSWDLVTVDNWTGALELPQVRTAITNSILLGVAAATLGSAIAAVASYITTRTRWRLRRTIETLTWAPIGVPGLVLALGFLWAFVDYPIYGTLWLLVLAFVVRGLPTGSRFTTSTMVQIGAELEEASRVHGGSWLQTFRSIWLPLLSPAFVSAWVFLFVIAVRILDLPLLLSGIGNEVLSVAIFRQVGAGDGAVAAVLALIQTAIILAAYILVRTLAVLLRRRGRGPAIQMMDVS